MQSKTHYRSPTESESLSNVVITREERMFIDRLRRITDMHRIPQMNSNTINTRGFHFKLEAVLDYTLARLILLFMVSNWMKLNPPANKL